MKYILVVFAIATIGLATGCTGPGHHLVYEQFESTSSGPILSIQGYVIKSNNKSDELQKRWIEIAEAMSQQPGFISGYLNPGLANSSLWLARSQWESLDALRAAFSDPDVLRLESIMPKQQFEHLFSLETNQNLSVCVRGCI